MTGAVFKTVCGAVLPSWVGSTPMPLRQSLRQIGLLFENAPTRIFKASCTLKMAGSRPNQGQIARRRIVPKGASDF